MWLFASMSPVGYYTMTKKSKKIPFSKQHFKPTLHFEVWLNHILLGSTSFSSKRLMSWLKLSFTASMLFVVLPERIHRFPRASGCNSKYFWIWKRKKEKERMEIFIQLWLSLSNIYLFIEYLFNYKALYKNFTCWV